MTRSIGKILVLFALIAMLVISCSSADQNSVQVDMKITDSSDNVISIEEASQLLEQGETINLTDQIGRVVKLDQMPERIVSLAPSNTETVFALGLGDKVVGVTTYCNYPAEAKDKPQVGGFSTVDIEQVVAQAPDLVLADDIHADEVIPELESKGLTVITLCPGTVDEVIQAIQMVGLATGTGPEAAEIVQDIHDRVNAVNNLVGDASDEEKPRVFYALWHDPLMTAGYDTLQGHIIEMAGGVNIFDDLTQYPEVSLEVLLERDPQVIIAGTGHGSGENATLDWAESNDQIKNTSARENGNVFEINADIVSRGGPRIVDAVEEMFKLLYPNFAEEL